MSSVHQGDPVGRPRELCDLEGRHQADDGIHGAGAGAAPHPRQRDRGPAPSARRSTPRAWSTEEAYKSLMTLVPYKRIGEPDDIAQAAAWLASRPCRLHHRHHLVRRWRHDALSRLRHRRLTLPASGRPNARTFIAVPGSARRSSRSAGPSQPWPSPARRSRPHKRGKAANRIPDLLDHGVDRRRLDRGRLPQASSDAPDQGGVLRRPRPCCARRLALPKA